MRKTMEDKKSVLIIDDNEGFRKTLSDVLHTRNYICSGVSTGERAFSALKQQKFAIAIIDLQLPDMDGLKVMKKCKDIDPFMECIVLTGYASLPSAIEAVNLGAYSYIQKPFRMEPLILTIQRALEKRETEKRIRLHEKRMRLAIESSEAGYFEHTVNFQDGSVSERWAAILGYDKTELPPIKNLFDWWRTLIHPEDQAPTLKAYEDLVNGDVDHYRLEFRILHRSGKWRWIQLTSKAVERDQQGRATVIAGIQLDITERKETEKKLSFLATHDDLTGLPNRVLFQDRLNLALEHTKRHDNLLAIMFLDLDFFKNVNDSQGHPVGDELLRKVAEKLISLLRKSDTVARVGGDEFLILLPEISQEQDALQVANKILHSLRVPFSLDHGELRITASIGVAIYPSHGEDGETLIKNADIAMYRAKNINRNTVVCFNQSPAVPWNRNVIKEES